MCLFTPHYLMHVSGMFIQLHRPRVGPIVAFSNQRSVFSIQGSIIFTKVQPFTLYLLGIYKHPTSQSANKFITPNIFPDQKFHCVPQKMHQKISFFFSLSCVSGTIFSWEKSKVLPQTTSPLPNLNWVIQAVNHPNQRTHHPLWTT